MGFSSVDLVYFTLHIRPMNEASSEEDLAPLSLAPRAPATNSDDDDNEEEEQEDISDDEVDAAEASAAQRLQQEAERARQLFADCLNDTPAFRQRLKLLERQMLRCWGHGPWAGARRRMSKSFKAYSKRLKPPPLPPLLQQHYNAQCSGSRG